MQPDEQKDKGPIEAAVDWLIEMLGNGIKKIKNWITKFIEWLEGMLPKPDKKTETSTGNWITPVRLVLMILLILLVAILAYIFVRIWQRRRTRPVEIVSAVAAADTRFD